MADSPRIASTPTAEAPVRPGDRVLLRTFVSLRWAGLVPLGLVLWLRRDELDRPWLAVMLAVVVMVFTAWTSITLRREPDRLATPTVCHVELVLAAALLAGDGWVLGWEHTFDPPALGALWPLAAVMTAGFVLGPRWGGVAGVAVVLSRLAGMAAPEVDHGPPSIRDILVVDGPRLIPIASLAALYVVAGVGAGYLTRLQRRAEDEIASARARNEVARTLHDGVLQTLAIFQRRSDDPTLARLARDTDRDLRSFLAGTGDESPTQLSEALRATCDRFAHRFDLTPQLLLDELPDQMDPASAQALANAVAEALANIGKHAAAHRVVVYAGPQEPDGGILVTVNDDGGGFDVTRIPDDRGLARSIRQRVEEIGGRVTVRSEPGQGTEVQLWLP